MKKTKHVSKAESNQRQHVLRHLIKSKKNGVTLTTFYLTCTTIYKGFERE